MSGNLRIYLSLLVVLTAAFASGIVYATPPNVRVNSDATTFLQNEEQIWISPKDANVVIAQWRDWRLGYRRCGIGVSTDGGASWSDSLFTDYPLPKHSDPCLVGDIDGNFYACALNYEDEFPEESHVVVWVSTDDGVSWSDPVNVCEWAPGDFEDKQMTACDRTGSLYSGNYYVTWTRFENPTRIIGVRSTDGCETFDDTVRIAGEQIIAGSTYGAGQFSMPTVGSDGKVHVFWQGYAEADEGYAVYAIRHAVSHDGGETFLPYNGHVINDNTIGYWYVDGNIDAYGCPISDCDISGGTYDNRLYYAQTQLDFNEYHTDIYVWRSDDGGVSWDGPVIVNDDPRGVDVDQFHPWVVVNDEGVVLVIFYDQRNDPGHYLFDAYFSCSFDGGETFIANMRVSDVSVNPDYCTAPKTRLPIDQNDPRRVPDPNYRTRAGKIAEYIGIHAKQDTVSTIWTDTRNGNQDAYSARFTIPFQKPRLLAPADSSLVSATPDLLWSTCWHEDQDSYRLEVSTDPTFTSVDYEYSGLTDNSFTMPVAIDSAWHFWRVKAFRTAGDSTEYSDVRAFTPGDASGYGLTLLAPLQNENNAPVNHDVVVTFIDQMDSSSINESTFRVYGNMSGAFTGSVTYDPLSNEATFFYDEQPLPGEVVSVVLTPGVRSLDFKFRPHGFQWLFTIAAAEAPGTFDLDSSYVCSEEPRWGTVADFNEDGLADVAVPIYGWNWVNVFINTGDGSMLGPGGLSTCSSPTSVCGIDMELDGDMDLAVACDGVPGLVMTFENDGTGFFGPMNSYNVGDYPVRIAAACVTNDGYPELITANDVGTVSLLINNGDGTFAPGSDISIGGHPAALTMNDLDWGGDIEMAVAVDFAGDDSVAVVLNNGGDQFYVSALYAVGSAPRDIVSCDLDFDHDLDVITADSTSQEATQLLNQGDVDATMGPITTFSTDCLALSLANGDVDGDGDLDVVTVDIDENDVGVMLNDGHGVSGVDDRYATGGEPVWIGLADFDGDGDLDAVTSDAADQTISILFNEQLYVCGDANGSGDVDIDDVVFIITYIFAGGVPPDPLESGDANCSGDVDIDDAVYLITYIFAGGNPPCDSDGNGTPEC